MNLPVAIRRLLACLGTASYFVDRPPRRCLFLLTSLTAPGSC